MINRKAIVQTAINAANDSEYGYESDDALSALQAIDPDYEWDGELLQMELEQGYRHMGPVCWHQPRGLGLTLLQVDSVYKDFYKNYIVERLSEPNVLHGMFRT